MMVTVALLPRHSLRYAKPVFALLRDRQSTFRGGVCRVTVVVPPPSAWATTAPSATRRCSSAGGQRLRPYLRGQHHGAAAGEVAAPRLGTFPAQAAQGYEGDFYFKSAVFVYL